MGAKADHDLWGQALAMESRYGDLGPDLLTDRIAALRSSGEEREADFWSLVADCLIQLHAIRYPGKHSLLGKPDISRNIEDGPNRDSLMREWGVELSSGDRNSEKCVKAGITSRF